MDYLQRKKAAEMQPFLIFFLWVIVARFSQVLAVISEYEAQ